jgi:lipoprotein NlpI
MSPPKWRFWSALSAAMMLLNYSAAADCDTPHDPEAAIIDCTQSINSGKWKGRDQAANYTYRGNGYRDKNDLDRAIADFNEAIRLDPKLAMAFLGRGLAFSDKGDNDRAIADFNEVIRLDPKFARAFTIRGIVFRDKGDLDRAIADFSEAIRIDPNSSLAYFARGLLSLFAGSAEKALADLDQASAHAPENAYLALWVDIASQRNNLPSRLAQASSRIDMSVWPAPVIRLFMDQMTPAAVLAAADDPDATRKKGRVCAANLYSGELSLTKGLKDEATRLFRLAASDCPHSTLEWDAANAELKALGVVP